MTLDKAIVVALCGGVGLVGVVWEGFFGKAEDGIREVVRERGLGEGYKRQRMES